MVDVFLPTMMHPCATRDDCSWHRSFAIIPPGAAMETVRAKLDRTSRAFERERAKGFRGMSPQTIEKIVAQNGRT
jgi:hypothetical protein